MTATDPKETLALPQNFEHRSLTMPREKLIKTAAKIARDDRIARKPQLISALGLYYRELVASISSHGRVATVGKTAFWSIL